MHRPNHERQAEVRPVRIRSLAGLALRGVAGSAYRSWLIGACALIVAAVVLSTVIVVYGARQSLHLAMDRLGADVVVVPKGAEAPMQGALLMGTPSKKWMPGADLQKIAAVRGVAVASPQLYLESLSNASCCSVSSMFVVAFDPATDFTLKPWLQKQLGGRLGLDDGVGGKYVFVPPGQSGIKLYGTVLRLKGNFEATGTNLDQSLFVTFATARKVARLSYSMAVKPLVIPKDGVSSVLVKVVPGADPGAVALDIAASVPGVAAISSPDMFAAYHSQINGLLRGLTIVLGLIVALALAVTALVFSMAAHERRRQIGVLRALGATRGAVLFSFLAEALILALAGGAVGVILGALCVYLFRALLVSALGFPFLFPSVGTLVALVAAGLAAALVVVSAAALLPVLRISRQEPADSMRE
jgi:putative ABC transport system permease protein